VADQTIRVLRIDQPGNSLATWLAAHHPDLFVAVLKQAQSQQVADKIRRRGLRGLADDPPEFISAMYDHSFTAPTVSEAGLDTITVNTDSIVPSNFLSDATDTGSSFLSNLGQATTSAGSSLASVAGSVGSGILGALGSVGSYLTSPVGLNNLTGLAKSFFGAQAAQSTAQTQQAVLQAQIGRAATGTTAAPITYQRDAAGNVVPVYATPTPQGTVYQPLSSHGIASLTPSGLSVFFSKYAVWIAGGVIVVGAVLAMRNR
jgi:hypothetical protein